MVYVQQENATSAPAGQHDVRRLKLKLSIVLGISLLCITIGIVTPGWIVHSLETRSVHAGLFYYVSCTKSPEKKCESVSFIKSYFDSLKGASDPGKIAITRNFCLGFLRVEIGAVLAWLLCLTALFIIVHRQSKQKNLIDYWLKLASALSVAGIIMGETICVYLVETDAANRLSAVFEGDAEKRYAAIYGGDVWSKLKFPYAMVVYMIGCILIFISVAMMSTIFKQEVNALRLRCNSNQPQVINEAFQT